MDIMDITEEGERLNGPGPLLIKRLPDVLSRTTEFIEAALSTRGPNDGVAYWAEQTFKAVQRIEKGVLTPPMTRLTSPVPKNTRTWASVATAGSRPSGEERALREVKVRITDTAERKALWTTANNTVLDNVARKAGEVRVVGVKKLPSGDIVIQLKERQGKEALTARSTWLSGVAPSARVIPDLYPVRAYRVLIKNIDTID